MSGEGASKKTTRRDFLGQAGLAAGLLAAGCQARRPAAPDPPLVETPGELPREGIVLFLCGDLMTGRGIDQILPDPGDPRLYESYMKDARHYVTLAEQASGAIPRAVDPAYPWGEALAELGRVRPDARLGNLETAVTARGEPSREKGIHYRMHPANAPCLAALGLDACSLANNHVLDWGQPALLDTLETLAKNGIRTAGAGRDRGEAEAPVIVEVPGKGRVLLLAFGHPSSGIPRGWAATDERPGVSLLPDLSSRTAERIGERVQALKRAGDIVVASIHWGGNWGYPVPEDHRTFARGLIEAGVDVIHGHSSHHPMGIEVYQGKPVLYGCGDFLNDYEGIQGREQFRIELVLMYFAALDPATGKLLRLEMTPLRLRRFQLGRLSREDVRWLQSTLHRESEKLGSAVALTTDDRLVLRF